MSKKNSACLAVSVFGLLLLVITAWTTVARAAVPPLQASNPPAKRAENASNTRSSPGMEADCLPGWQRVTSPNAGEPHNVLLDIDAVSAADIWAVGGNLNSSSSKLIIQHWDGTQWTFSGQDVSDGLPGYLEGVAAVAADDVWAAGTLNYPGVSSGRNRVAMLLHWDGMEWDSVETPLPEDSGASGLMDIAAGAPNDVWAVGYVYFGDVMHTFTLHWDGVSWRSIPIPGGEGILLRAVSVGAGGDAWAVGNTYPGSAAVAFHWNGTAWESVPLPGGMAASSSLEGVVAISPDDVWAVGRHSGRPLMLHWDGQQWLDTSPASEDSYDGTLFDIVALSPDDVWAAGEYLYAPVGGPLLSHWDGTGWTAVPGPDIAGTTELLMGLTATSSQDIWGAGRATSQGEETFVVRTSGNTCNSPTGTPTVAVTATHTATPSSTPTSESCEPNLARVDSPNNTTGRNTFFDVVPRASNDVWAAGNVRNAGTSPGHKPRIEHFDGTQWSVVYEPAEASWRAVIYGLAVIAPDDIWAAGRDLGVGGYPLLHWDGNGWSEHTYPGMTGKDSLYSIQALSANDIWAVGVRDYEPAVLHWDGNSWSAVTMPLPTIPGTIHPAGALHALSVLSPDDVWAVGVISGWDEAGNTRVSGALVAHWNGESWDFTSNTPDPGFGRNYVTLHAVSALATDDVWAVGHNHGPVPFVIHWDGVTWSTIQVPKLPYATKTALFGVTAVAEDDVWIVGTTNGGTSVNDMQSHVLHWDGAVWEIVPSLRPGETQNLLRAVAATEGKPSEIWMVGTADGPTSSDTLALRLNRPCVIDPATATPTASPTGTATPSPTSTTTATPTAASTLTSTATATATTNQATHTPTAPATTTSTATPTLPSSTATAIAAASATSTVTACGLQFADLPNGNTFRPFALCLACKGILSGYPCGGHGEPCDGQKSPYFRPGSLVTRGQVAKIVANALGLAGAPGGQLFEDVPPGSPFYSYVNRLTALGVMSGYPCGGPGEACGAGGLPFFRPDRNATRGQIAKIVSNGAGYDEAPTDQTFEDVPATDTFYLPVERLASRAVMGGYDCNGPGEPCGPDGRPYFRPGSNATRGQVAKIVANTFFEECSVK